MAGHYHDSICLLLRLFHSTQSHSVASWFPDDSSGSGRNRLSGNSSIGLLLLMLVGQRWSAGRCDCATAGADGPGSPRGGRWCLTPCVLFIMTDGSLKWFHCAQSGLGNSHKLFRQRFVHKTAQYW